MASSQSPIFLAAAIQGTPSPFGAGRDIPLARHWVLVGLAFSWPELLRPCRYMGFSELTLIPIQRKLINIHALLEKEILWVDRYHERVWKEISPRLGDDEETRAWLKDATAPLKAVLAA